MKKIVIFLLLNMFTVCNVYKCNDTDNISKEESEKAGETIHQPDTILIEFDGGIHIPKTNKYQYCKCYFRYNFCE